MAITIATWNVNSIKVRLDGLVRWLKAAQPDILCLQEIKCETKAFPTQILEDLGYNLAVCGQKSYNGVAILSKWPLGDVSMCLPGDDGDEQARYLEAVVSVPQGAVRVASIYLPNGNPPDTAKYSYKLGWMERLKAHARALLTHEEMLVLAGDYNVIPDARDVYDPVGWARDALFKLETRRAFREILNLGLTDAFRAVNDAPGLYSFWDYQGGAWRKNLGLRIDHLLLSPEAAARLQGAWIDKAPRGWEAPSDHAPVLAQLAA